MALSTEEYIRTLIAYAIGNISLSAPLLSGLGLTADASDRSAHSAPPPSNREMTLAHQPTIHHTASHGIPQVHQLNMGCFPPARARMYLLPAQTVHVHPSRARPINHMRKEHPCSRVPILARSAKMTMIGNGTTALEQIIPPLVQRIVAIPFAPLHLHPAHASFGCVVS